MSEKTRSKEKFSLSLRSKMVIILSLAVITVSSIILYFSSEMIYKDKKAYLYDTAFLSLDTSYSSLEHFFESKKNVVSIYRFHGLGNKEEEALELAKDPDLFQVISFVPDDVSAFERVYEPVYINQKYLQNYKKREDFLKVPDRFFAGLTGEVHDGKLFETLYFEQNAPHLILAYYDSVNNKVYCFDYLLDRILNDVINKQAFEVTLVNNVGESLFHNKPYNLTSAHAPFFRIFIGSKTSVLNNTFKGGVEEVNVGDAGYIMGYRKVDRFKDFYLFSGIKTNDAYEVTSILILNTAIYAVCLVAFFNILSIFLARSITNPLNRMTKVIQNIAGGDYKARIESQSTKELQIVGEAFNGMVVKIHDFQNKLTEYNKTLEKKVEDRTQKLSEASNFIKAMVDSLDEGLLVVDRNGFCLDLYTKAAEELIGTRPTNKKLADLIKAEDKALFNEWLKNLFEETIPFETMAEFGPSNLPCTLQYTDEKFKHITLDYYPMRDETGKIKNIVMVASDKTREFKANKEVEVQEGYVRLVSNVMKDKNNFMRFVSLFESSFADAKNRIIKEGSVTRNDVMRMVHSMKGSAAFYSMPELVAYLHDLETDLTARDMSVEEALPRLDASVEKFQAQVNRLKDFLGTGSKSMVELEEEQLRNFGKFLAGKNIKVAEVFAQYFLEKPVEQYVEQYKSLVLDLASRLGKRVHPLEVQNGDLKADLSYFRPFFDSTIHMFRNAVDHAIETPEARMNKGKPEYGTISVSFDIVTKEGTKNLVFSLKDDGKGIDPERIRNKMRELNYPEDQLNQSDDKIIYHIFDASFSTAERLTDVSGRGVGLFDIKENVSSLGGEIILQSEAGLGSSFIVSLPFPNLEKLDKII